MKNLFTKKSLLKMAILGGASFCIVILFAACKNFLNAKETKSEIDAAIAYANASTYPIYIKYSGKNGVVKSPAGSEISKKVTDIFTLSFDPIGDYEFVSWKITNDTTNEELPNGEYLKIEDILNSETKCTFVKAPEPDMKLCLSPVVTERPQILSYAPMLGTEMSFKDSAIQVVFDYPMDIYSIYYTDEELTDLMAELGITDKDDPSLLKTTITQNETEQIKYYGYKKEGITYFKNISITASETGEILTGFFKAPIFDTETKLLIKVADYSSLPDYGEIKVEIGKDFFYTLNGKKITMSGNKKWLYQIKETRDNEAPVILQKSVKVVLPDGSDVLTKGTYSDTILNKSKITEIKDKIITSDNTTFNFNVRVRDEGNGMKPYFHVYYQMIYDSSYEKTNYKYVNHFKVPYQSVTTYDASYNGDFSKSIGSGIYKFILGFEDSVGNIVCWPDVNWKPDNPDRPGSATNDWSSNNSVFVLAVDRTVPQNTASLYGYSNTDNSISLCWQIDPLYSYQNYNDLDVVKIIKKSTGEILQEQSFSDVASVDYTKLYELTNVNALGDTDICFQFFDIAGNITQIEKTISVPSDLANEFVLIPGRKYAGTQIPSLIVSDHEVTQKEYSKYMTWYNEKEPSEQYGVGDYYPAYNVNWYETIMYCNLRSMDEGLTPVYYLGDYVNNYDIAQWSNSITLISNKDSKYFYNSTSDSCDELDAVKVNPAANGYRLPTEPEWVYIAERAGRDKYIYIGTDDSIVLKSKYAHISEGGKAFQVKGKEDYGKLYDMCGNVEEWSFTNNDSKRYKKGGFYGAATSSGVIKIADLSSKHSATFRNVYAGFRVVRTYIPQ